MQLIFGINSNNSCDPRLKEAGYQLGEELGGVSYYLILCGSCMKS